jgi:hypothetical protein
VTVSVRWVASTLAVGTLLASAASCARPFVEPGQRGGVTVKSARLGWYTKKVVAKRAPETLLADDGTICRVAPDRFRATDTGAAVYCNWQ